MLLALRPPFWFLPCCCLVPPSPCRFAADATARAKIIKSELKIKKSRQSCPASACCCCSWSCDCCCWQRKPVRVAFAFVSFFWSAAVLPLCLLPCYDVRLSYVACLRIRFCTASHTLTCSNSAFSGLQVSHVSAKWRPQNRHGVMQRVYVCT